MNPGASPRVGRLPHLLDTFVGREREVGELARLVSACRLVTLIW